MPQVYYRDFSGATAAALRIFPGDTVRTKTLDANGEDEKGVPRALPNNPLNGPFYIEGAMSGDTIAVHFNRIRPNRDTAVQVRDALLASALPPGYRQPPWMSSSQSISFETNCSINRGRRTRTRSWCRESAARCKRPCNSPQDPETHVVARIGKDVLGQLPQPAKPKVIFCRPQWGCALD